jgi:hypothetical protein
MIDVVIAFFILGIVASLIKSEFEFPKGLYQALSIFLMLAIGLKGGIALADKSLLRKAGKLVHEVCSSQGILLMVGGLIIGFFFADSSGKIMPFFTELFYGFLALFLLQMGMVAGRQLHDLKTLGLFVTSFGILMPLIGAGLGGVIGYAIGLSNGGIILLSVLGASASYIAVPAAMAVALPQANNALAITASLAITFPFNVIVGIPVYVGVVQALNLT